MATYESDFIRAITKRGYLHQCTDLEALDAQAAEKSIAAYIGFDCTAPSLHAGSLVSIMLLRQFQKAGHKPIVLMGGGTTKVGDPSGKDDSRKILSDADISANIAGIKQVFSKFLTFGDGPTDAVVLNNADWLDKLNYISFLRRYGPHFTINRMMTFDSVKLRLEREQPLTFLEFNYMILQAYDFVELAMQNDCILQMGGSDQWGNIVGGVELGRRVSGKRLFGLTTPLLTTASGAKMGKTASGAVWLNADMLSPYDYWQYWRNAEDADIGRFLRLFTDLPMEEITRLEALAGAEINEAKKVLATEATRLCHGKTAADEAAGTAKQAFEQGQAAEGLPTVEISRARLESGIPVFILMREAGLVGSGGEAKQLIKGGGGKLNDHVIDKASQAVTMADIGNGGVIKLSAGKKRHALVKAI